MREFWDERARENAWYFIDNRLDYRRPDLERFWESGRADLDSILEALSLEIGAADEVVEIGCGAGRLTRVLAERAAAVWALDVSPRMLAVAREENPELANVRWLESDGSTLEPIADASADACVSHVVFQHIPDPAVTLGYVREIGRVLRPGGWAAIQVSNDPEVHRRRRPPLRERLGALVGRAPRGRGGAAWLGSAVEIGALREAAHDGGMEVERIVGEGTQFCLVRLRRRPAG